MTTYLTEVEFYANYPKEFLNAHNKDFGITYREFEDKYGDVDGGVTLERVKEVVLIMQKLMEIPVSELRKNTIVQNPTVSRMVHYIDPAKPMRGIGERHLAAVISGVNEDGTVELTVFQPRNESFSVGNVKYDDTAKKVSMWHWPERE